MFSAERPETDERGFKEVKIIVDLEEYMTWKPDSSWGAVIELLWG